jgi:hypothetical protein
MATKSHLLVVLGITALAGILSIPVQALRWMFSLEVEGQLEPNIPCATLQSTTASIAPGN